MRSIFLFMLLLLPLFAWAQVRSEPQQGVEPQVLPPQPGPPPQVLLPQRMPGVQLVQIQRLEYGSGTPPVQFATGAGGGSSSGEFEAATAMGEGIYHAPQYLPGYPTSHVIFPRVLEVPCIRLAPGSLRCRGYELTPATGRGEYLFFRPVVAEAPAAHPTAALPARQDLAPGPEVAQPPAGPAQKPRARHQRRKPDRG